MDFESLETSWMVDRLVGRLLGRLVVRLAGRLVGRLVFRSSTKFDASYRESIANKIFWGTVFIFTFAHVFGVLNQICVFNLYINQ